LRTSAPSGGWIHLASTINRIRASSNPFPVKIQESILFSKEKRLGRDHGDRRTHPDMIESLRGQKTPPRRALQETLLKEIGLHHVLEGVPWLGQRGRQCLDAHRTATEVLRQHADVATIQ